VNNIIRQMPVTFDGLEVRTLQENFQIVIMIAIETTHRDALAVALQFPAHNAVLAAVIRLDSKTAVGPELALGAEAMGCLQQDHQQGGANRSDRRNLAKQFDRRMLLTFPQQLASCC